ncbi:lytic polysaccharide monooxygenase [Candidatus Sodalis endolongispinus]|uniref:Lytic polysaccharide monooxygenase n=1 Tax=Candidatus Sodalis endolongispinus TaxID=2812662 RepID=A0ABS5YCD7_9GAMM|nr:lytic polysaccharide monooxygenase [Candidatus Sodalis endolongispinus]MBT9432628.1 lytic polysaccharide monooxygenase [Candidatus Sodalis endolongispinus]
MKKLMIASLLMIPSIAVMAEDNIVTPKHGYVSIPASRASLCQQGINTDCGPVQYEPQSVEGPKGFPEKWPKDMQIASGQNANFQQLNQQTLDRWKKVDVHTGENTFTWTLTAAHKTTSWKFFITKPDWNANKPLVRADFDLTPFCERYDDGATPKNQVEIDCNVPSRTGYHLILGTWDIFNTGNAFYQVIDANIIDEAGLKKQ